MTTSTESARDMRMEMRTIKQELEAHRVENKELKHELGQALNEKTNLQSELEVKNQAILKLQQQIKKIELAKESYEQQAESQNQKLLTYETRIRQLEQHIDETWKKENDESTVIVTEDTTLMAEHRGEHSSEKCFNLEPSNIVLIRISGAATLLFTSHFHSTVEYKISVSPAALLVVSPSVGKVNPGEIRKILVFCGRSYIQKWTAYRRQEFKLILEVEDEVFGVSVSVINW